MLIGRRKAGRWWGGEGVQGGVEGVTGGGGDGKEGIK